MKAFTLLSLVYPVAILAAVGDRCSNKWGDDCICLKSDVCKRNGGVSNAGSAGNFPCPKDPDDVIGCVIKTCPGKGSNTQCLWKSGCQDVSKGKLGSFFLVLHIFLLMKLISGVAAVCPGGEDFVCCNHHLGDNSSVTPSSGITNTQQTATSTAPPTTTEEPETSTGTSAASTSAPNTSTTSVPTVSSNGTSSTSTPPVTAGGAVNVLGVSGVLGGFFAVVAALL